MSDMKIMIVGGGVATVTKTCPVCKNPAVVHNVPIEGLEKWDHGRGSLIQVAFPTLSAEDREMILTGTHDACWNSMFPEEEDE